MVQTRYDAAGQVIGTVAYVTRRCGSEGGAHRQRLRAARPAKPNPADVSEYRYYTAGGRLAMTVSGTGDVVSYAYDGNGNVTERIAYATRLPAARSIGAAQMPAPPQLNPVYDQRQRTVYDALDRAVFQVDALGGVVRQRYDGNGNVIERAAYAARIPAGTAMTEAAITAARRRWPIPRATSSPSTSMTPRAGSFMSWTAPAPSPGTPHDASGNLLTQIRYATRLRGQQSGQRAGGGG